MDAVVAQSEASMRQGSSSFDAAARLFGRRLREDVWQLYAWCRHCDDEIDGQDHGGQLTLLSPTERAERLARLERETRAALAGDVVEDPAFVAFQRVALRHRIAPQWPLELLEGFAQDVDGQSFETLEATLRYCWGVAGTVGVMMARIMGVDAVDVLRRAQDLGLAFQLTNICRDIREDAQGGRVYLPADRLAALGVDIEPAARLAADPAVAFPLALELLDLAEDYYASARVGLRHLPFRGALAVAAARDIYRSIGRRIRKGGPESLLTRMRTPKPLMLLLLLRGGGVALWSRLERFAPARPRPPLWSRL